MRYRASSSIPIWRADIRSSGASTRFCETRCIPHSAPPQDGFLSSRASPRRSPSRRSARELYLVRSLGISLAHPWIATARRSRPRPGSRARPFQGRRVPKYRRSHQGVRDRRFVAFGVAAIRLSGAGRSPRRRLEPVPTACLRRLSRVDFLRLFGVERRRLCDRRRRRWRPHAVTRALLSGTILVIALYIGVSAVILYGAPSGTNARRRGIRRVAALALGGSARRDSLERDSSRSRSSPLRRP